MAFYEPLGDGRYRSTAYTQGPWAAGSQHAGPPAALLGRAVEQLAPAGMRVARLTFDIARPVPIATLQVTATVRRAGRGAAIVEAAIEPYLRCTALLIRAADSVAPQVAVPNPAALVDAEPRSFLPVPYEVGYHTAMDVRFAAGSFAAPGPATAWMRMRVPLVDGEAPSPLTRVLVAADSGNGISSTLDFDRFVFLNADLSVHLVRHPIGEWVCLDALSTIDPAGIGLADTTLYDAQGRIGRSAQSLFVAPRPAT